MTIDSLIILLGPYRNISTLTSSVFSLHPNVQVLNHAMDRLFEDEGTNFLAKRNQASLAAFIAAASEASAEGRQGTYGGSILHSHAYRDAPALRDAYVRRYGDIMVKPLATHLLWKESLRVQNRLTAEAGSLDDLIARIPKIRFLLPVRNPLHCALSNHNPHFLKLLQLAADATIEETLVRIFERLRWVLEAADRHPASVMAFTQNDPVHELCHRWCAFFELPADAQWMSDVETHFRVREKPAPTAEMADLTRRLAADYLGEWPGLVERLAL